MAWRVPTRPVRIEPEPVVAESVDELMTIDLRGERAVVEYRPVVDNRWSLLVALVVLNALDLVTTAAVIERGGSESNPLMRPLVDGVWPAVLLKGVVLALIGCLLMRCASTRRVEVMMAGATGWYLAVVSWNLTVLGLG